MKSRTQRALDLVAKGTTPYAAARKLGLTPSNLYRKPKPKICPKCGWELTKECAKTP